jgi:parallel beta-helix repeat protein
MSLRVIVKNIFILGVLFALPFSLFDQSNLIIIRYSPAVSSQIQATPAVSTLVPINGGKLSLFLPVIMAGAQPYYVSPSGNDANPGTFSKPWRTIRKAASKVLPGDTVYIRGGVYRESVDFTKSGTSNAPIRILAYPGETPIIDGNNYSIPGSDWGVLLSLSGSYIYVSGLEVRYSSGMGVILSGIYDTVDKINSHHNQQNGILITGDYGRVQNSLVWSNCMANVNGSAGQNSSGLSAARYPNYAVISRNTVYSNWGEGISTYQANGTIIEDNTSYDNWSLNVYISDATNVLLQRNLVYTTGAMSGGSQVGIAMGDEKYDPPSANITIINNIAYRNAVNLWWWQGSQGGGMSNVLIANNTLVNSTRQAGMVISKGSHQNVRIKNNLVVQDGTLPVIALIPNSQLFFSNNLWSKTPDSAASGPGDVVGDPKLAKTGTPYQPAWYQLTASSPAIDKAVTLIEVSVDYFGNPRGTLPDIGAIEYGFSGH